MAMLAEPRQRKRYNLVPRGKALYEDDSRFGTKMLEKMGWSKGKGLGSKEDGSQDFVRVRYKNDIQGLGYEQRDDQWTQHESSFNGLLKSLNGEETMYDNVDNGKKESVESEDDMPRVGFGFPNEPKQDVPKATNSKLKEKISGVSLEERSKQSKARVHYKKFTKGKDLSQYSEKDLANIFGKKAVDEQEAATDNLYKQLNQIVAETNENGAEQKDETENFGGVQTISTGLSVSEYFKMKMASLKNRSQQLPVVESDANNTGVVDNSNDKEDYSAKKKLKKNKDRIGEFEDQEFGITSSLQVCHSVVPEKSEGEKKRKRKKELSNGGQDLQVMTDSIANSGAIEEISKKKKKSKKRKHEDCSEENKTNGEPEIIHETECTEGEKSKNKRKCEDITSRQNNNTLTKPIKNIDPEIACEVEASGEEKSSEDLAKNNAKVKRKSKKKNKGDAQNVDTVEGKISQSAGHPNEQNGFGGDIEFSDSHNMTLDTIRQISLHELKEKLDSYNICQLSTFTAEKFRNVDLNYFPNSTLSQVDGYRYNKGLQLRVDVVKNDERRINNLWSTTLCKYANLEKPTKTYKKYAKQIKIAKQTKQPKPKLHTKTWMRKNAFSLG